MVDDGKEIIPRILRDMCSHPPAVPGGGKSLL